MSAACTHVTFTQFWICGRSPKILAHNVVYSTSRPSFVCMRFSVTTETVHITSKQIEEYFASLEKSNISARAAPPTVYTTERAHSFRESMRKRGRHLRQKVHRPEYHADKYGPAPTQDNAHSFYSQSDSDFTMTPTWARDGESTNSRPALSWDKHGIQFYSHNRRA